MKYNKEYFDSNAEKLSNKYDCISFDDVHGHWAKDYLFEGKDVLDVGSGNGRDSVYMAARGARVTAIDFSERLINIAREKDIEHKVRWVYQVLPNITDQDILGGKFDLILISAVLMFLSHNEQDEAVSSLLELLKRQGSCIITFKEDSNDSTLNTITPNLDNLSRKFGCELQSFSGGKDWFGRMRTSWSIYMCYKL